MASGVAVCDEVKNLYDTMKVVHNEDKPEDRVRLAIFKIVKNNEVIEISKKYTQKDLGDSTPFSIFCQEMDECPCFYALYDCHFETESHVEKDELIFITWTSDAGAIKNKMLYSSSKEQLKKCFQGVKHTMQLNDRSDWSKKTIAEKLQDKNSLRVAKIDNVPI
uniref:Destrin-like n=2 Tax=Acanthochromis polyacanthus TaxID=80966 RepID=A0A3Q1FZB1_9TELE